MPLVELETGVLQGTAARLHRRIGERFPGSGLEQRGEDLLGLLYQVTERASRASEPIRWVRGLYVLLALLVLVGLFALPIEWSQAADVEESGWIAVVESGINDLILLGGGIFFLATLETRIKRGRALKELHEIRSFVHVIDMMQLTKDPHRLVNDPALSTASSPTRDMNVFEFGRYLDYCSELAALASKGAAVIAQHFDDPVVLATVNEIESLSTGLSGKIWQKLTLLSAHAQNSTPPLPESQDHRVER